MIKILVRVKKKPGTFVFYVNLVPNFLLKKKRRRKKSHVGDLPLGFN